MSTSRKNVKDTNATNIQIAQMANDFNAAQLDKQIAEQWKMWRAENEYNSPSAKRQRLEEAGYNPFMNTDGGVASSMTAPSPHPAVVPTMQVPPSGLQDFATFMAGLGDILRSASGVGIAVPQIAGQVQTNAYNKKAYVTHLKMLNDNSKILGVTANNEATRQNLQITGQELSNNMAYEQIRGHVIENMKASVELQALPEQLRLGLAHLTTDLKLKYQQGDLNKRQIEKVIEDIRNVRLEGDYMEQTMDSRVRQAEAQAVHAESNQGSDNPYQLGQDVVRSVQDFLRHNVLDQDPSYPFTNMIRRNPSGTGDTVDVSKHWWR